MRSFRLYRKPKVNPLQTEKEKAIEEITSKVREWSFSAERAEILTAVCGRVFIEGRHIQKNPKRVKGIW